MRCRLPCRTRTEIVSAVMNISLLMPHTNAASERPFSTGNDIGKEHCFELELDTLQVLASIKKNHLMCRTLVLLNPSCSLNAHNEHFDGITSVLAPLYLQVFSNSHTCEMMLIHVHFVISVGQYPRRFPCSLPTYHASRHLQANQLSWWY